MTYLTLQIESGGVRIRPLRSERIRELFGCLKHLVLLFLLAFAQNCLVKLVRRVEHRSDARRVVVDSRIDDDCPVAGVRLWGRRKPVDAPGLDVY